MPIIDKELVSVNEDPSGYKPSVTCQSIVQKIRENIALHGDAVWMANFSMTLNVPSKDRLDDW
ncbi:hypothetical protein OUZ56_014637 [Daphnia magna]|uniref:Uncharacterized protein n=1 Tax=Daphnia magna TaxID=35525 RepID=A0ABR0AKC9_9CRUS|nr:hypothetical protein OUZ56_014637 [Daphnia magna]